MSVPGSTTTTKPRLDPDDYTVAWLAVLPIEAQAALAVLDKRHRGTFESSRSDDYIYYGGEIGGHNVVIATWPAGQVYGPGSAAALASQVKARFRNLWFALLVGVAAGCPNLSATDPIERRDIRLGDVLVSVPDKECSGIVQYDLGRDTDNGFFPNGRLNSPPAILLSAVGSIMQDQRHPFKKGGKLAQHLDALMSAEGNQIFACPSSKNDILYDVETSTPLTRPVRDESEQIRVWLGSLASGGSLMRNARRRDELRDVYNLIGFEMEAAGVMNVLPTGVVRGVCDYGDKFKNKSWQPYAAITAAVYASGVLNSISPAVQRTRNVHWTITKAKNTYFTGRYDVVVRIKEVVKKALSTTTPSGQCRIVVTGIGGQGKSEICLQVADHLRSRFWGVFWVDVSDSLAAEDGFLDIAAQLGKTAQTCVDVLRILASIPHPWLLILDNADDVMTDYSVYFPSGSLGIVMLASRNRQCEVHATPTGLCQPLEGLTEAESRHLLLSAAHISPHECQTQEQDITAVLSLLGGHPLALIHAGTYVGIYRCTFRNYHKLLMGQRERLLKFQPTQAMSRYGDTFATFEASATSLRLLDSQASADALDLLHLISMCALASFSLVLFEEAWHASRVILWDEECGSAYRNDLVWLKGWHIAQLPVFSRLRKHEWDNSRLMDAIHMLETHSLISVRKVSEDVTVHMHPLVYAWAKARQNDVEQRRSWLAAACVLVVAAESSRIVHTLGTFWSQAHLQALLSVGVSFMLTTGPNPMIVDIILRFREQLALVLKFRQIRSLMEDLLTSLDLSSRKVDSLYLELYRRYGADLRASGDDRRAALILEQVVETYEQSSSPDLDRLSRTQLDLAAVYMKGKVGTATRAIPILKRAIKIRQREFDEYGAELSDFELELAIAYRRSRQPGKAISLLESILEREENRRSTDDSVLLRTLRNLAVTYSHIGERTSSIQLYQRIIGSMEQTSQPDNPSLLGAKTALACEYHRNGQVEQPIALLEQVVETKIQSRTDKEDEREERTLVYEHDLSVLLWRIGRRNDAIKWMRETVQRCQQIWDDDNRFRQDCEADLKDMESRSREEVAEQYSKNRDYSMMIVDEPDSTTPPVSAFQNLDVSTSQSTSESDEAHQRRSRGTRVEPRRRRKMRRRNENVEAFERDVERSSLLRFFKGFRRH